MRRGRSVPVGALSTDRDGVRAMKLFGWADQPACKPGSVGPGRRSVRTWRPFLWDDRRRPPRATNPGDWPGERACPSPREAGRAAPIRSCSRWGLPCRPRCRVRGALLPHPFTLTPARSGNPVRGGLLSVALSLGSPPPDVIRHRLSMEPGLSSPSPEEPGAAARPTDPARMWAGSGGTVKRATSFRCSPSRPTAPARAWRRPSAGSRSRYRPATSRTPCSRRAAAG